MAWVAGNRRPPQLNHFGSGLRQNPDYPGPQRSLAIPSGLRAPAQGCETRAALSCDSEIPRNSWDSQMDSIPNVFLVPFDLVLAQRRTQLILKSNLAMMFLLPGNVLPHLFKIGLAHREICIAALPF
jgi:hypothetical protein